MRVDWHISLLGMLVGLLVGLTGVGGAALLTPILVLVGINPTIAIGTDLFYNSITKLFGTWQHLRQKTVQLKLVRNLALGSIPGAVVAVLFLRSFDVFFHNQELLVKKALGVVLVIAAIATIIKQVSTLRRRSSPSQDEAVTAAEEPGFEASSERRGLTIAVGFVLGFVVGLTSIGSGSLFALFMIYFFKLKASKVVGTDIAHAFLLVTAAGLMHASFGHVDFSLAGSLLIGSVPGVLMGSKLSSKVPAAPLRTIMATLIFISGIKLF